MLSALPGHYFYSQKLYPPPRTEQFFHASAFCHRNLRWHPRQRRFFIPSPNNSKSQGSDGECQVPTSTSGALRNRLRAHPKAGKHAPGRSSGGRSEPPQAAARRRSCSVGCPGSPPRRRRAAQAAERLPAVLCSSRRRSVRSRAETATSKADPCTDAREHVSALFLSPHRHVRKVGRRRVHRRPGLLALANPAKHAERQHRPLARPARSGARSSGSRVDAPDQGRAVQRGWVGHLVSAPVVG